MDLSSSFVHIKRPPAESDGKIQFFRPWRAPIVPCIPVGKQKLYFFPDRILIIERRSVGAVSYGELYLDCNNTRFVEDGLVPPDTIVVDYTWSYVNKNGGPDRRFKNNRQIPVVLYSELHFHSSTGLNEMIQVSRPDTGKKLKRYLNHYDFSYLH